ncbi:hypothetical protein QL285_049122 [Trifolium repens]|nr:hypothetical protein QL285_049122 [Trifolium repens]
MHSPILNWGLEVSSSKIFEAPSPNRSRSRGKSSEWEANESFSSFQEDDESESSLFSSILPFPLLGMLDLSSSSWLSKAFISPSTSIVGIIFSLSLIHFSTCKFDVLHGLIFFLG